MDMKGPVVSITELARVAKMLADGFDPSPRTVEQLIASIDAARDLLSDIEDWDYSRAQLPKRLTERFDAALGGTK